MLTLVILSDEEIGKGSEAARGMQGAMSGFPSNANGREIVSKLQWRPVGSCSDSLLAQAVTAISFGEIKMKMVAV